MTLFSHKTKPLILSLILINVMSYRILYLINTTITIVTLNEYFQNYYYENYMK